MPGFLRSFSFFRKTTPYPQPTTSMDEFSHKEQEAGLIKIDEALIKHLFFAYRPGLLRRAENLVGTDQAYDIVQKKFSELWEDREKLKFRNELALKSYLYNGVQKRAIDYLRKIRIERRAMEDLKNADLGFEHPDEWDRQEMLQRALDLLDEAIAGLPEKYKGMMEMLRAGHSMSEIAKTFNVHEGTVRSNLFKARESLRKQISGKPGLPVAILLLLDAFILGEALHHIH